jgi:hypothetical protein
MRVGVPRSHSAVIDRTGFMRAARQARAHFGRIAMELLDNGTVSLVRALQPPRKAEL